MAIQNETELYKPIKLFLENLGYEVKGEVRGCDLVALHVKEEEPVIVELKKTFNLSLLFQGVDRLKICSQVFLAVEHIRGRKRPIHQKWSNIQQLCLRLGLGLITVQFYKTKKPHVEILCYPSNSQPFPAAANSARRKKSSRKTTRIINEFKERSGDYNVGGSTQKKLVTAYREIALQLAYYLKEQGPLSPLQLRELTGKQKTASILQKNYYDWFQRVRRGIYQISSEGEKALETYKKVINKDTIDIKKPL